MLRTARTISGGPGMGGPDFRPAGEADFDEVAYCG